MRDMLGLENEMENRVKGAVGQMELTAALFAPLMMGASVSIFMLMDRVSMPDSNEGVGSILSISSTGGTAMNVSTFILLAGGYMILLALSTTVTMWRLRNGCESGGWGRVPARVAQSMTAFTLGVIGGITILG